MKNFCILTCLAFLALITSGQSINNQRHYCYTDELWSQMVQKDSSLLQKKMQMDALISRYSNSHAVNIKGNAKSLNSAPSVVIPTVIYIVYDTQSVNISMAQIQSQMDQLNQNFAPYGYSFCYAKINVVTNSAFTPQVGDSAGVFRISSPLSNVNSYTNDAQLKALSDLPSANYLRIFVVHTIAPQGVLGYTIWPGTSAEQDGIVILSSVCGSNNFCNSCQLYPDYNLGAALTHEVGHFLDLYHTFQGGCDTGSGTNACQIYGDQICDTPPTDGSFGCPNPAPLSCDGINHELIENYMDYTSDPCKNSFTAGQKERMDFGTSLYHSDLVSTQNLLNTGVTCVALGNSYASFYSANFDGCTSKSMTFSSLGTPSFDYQWNFGDGSTATGATVNHIFDVPGKYLVTLTATNQSQGITATNSNQVFITDCNPISCSTNKLDFNFGFLDFSSGTPIAVNHAAEATTFPFALYYLSLYRSSTNGQEGFFVGDAIHGLILYDTALNPIYRFPYGTPYSLLPVPGNKGEYCYISGLLDSLGNSNDSDVYCIIETDSGALNIRSDRENIYLTQSMPQGFSTIFAIALTAIPNCDGSKIWVLAQPDVSTVNIYSMDSSALFTFVQSYSLPQGFECAGLRASPDGSKIVSAYSATNELGFAILNFDKSAGLITSSQFINEETPSQFVGGGGSITSTAVFSPNSRFLYASGPCCFQTGNNLNYVYQYDLQNSDIVGTRKSIYQYSYDASQGSPLYQYYIGPDEKIYIGHQTQPGNSEEAYRLSVINYPDIIEDGTGSTGFNLMGPDIRPANCPYSLTLEGFGCFIDQTDAFGCAWSPGKPSMFNYSSSQCYTYQFYFDECFSAQWNFGDTISGIDNFSTVNAPSHTFSKPGNYIVTLASEGYSFSDTIHINTPNIQIASTPIGPCSSPIANYSIANIQPFVNYIWSVKNGTPSTVQGQNNINVNWNTADTDGTITVIAIDTVMGCTDTSVLTVNYNISDSATVNNTNAFLCAGSSYTFGNQVLTVPGIYADTIRTSKGCLSITRLNLMAGVISGVSWPGGSDTINFHTGGISLSGGTPAGGVYSGSGVIGNTLYTDSLATGSYTVTYTYTDSTGCSGTAIRIFVILGVEDINFENEIHLYPNPTNNSVTIQSDLFSSSKVQIALYDITGRLILAPVKKYADIEIFNISELANGLYCFKLNINGRETIKRFVKTD